MYRKPLVGYLYQKDYATCSSIALKKWIKDIKDHQKNGEENCVEKILISFLIKKYEEWEDNQSF